MSDESERVPVYESYRERLFWRTTWTLIGLVILTNLGQYAFNFIMTAMYLGRETTMNAVWANEQLRHRTSAEQKLLATEQRLQAAEQEIKSLKAQIAVKINDK